MRIALATLTVASSLAAQPVLAEQQFSFTLGAMQRSYSDDVVLVIDSSRNPLLTSDQTSTAGPAFAADLVGDQGWARLMAYADRFDATFANASTIGLNVSPRGIGLFGPNPKTADFERSTGLVRFDALHQLTELAGAQIYGGLSFAFLEDNLDLVIATNTGNARMDTFLHGRTNLIGLAVGGRYDLAPNLGPEALSLSAFGTLGVYHASHSVNYSAISSGPGVGALNEQAFATDSGITGAAEIGLTANYSLSETSDITLTYQAAFYGDAVNTPGAVGQTVRRPTPARTAVATDSVLYQGLSLGYVMRF